MTVTGPALDPPLIAGANLRPLRVLHVYSGNLFGGVERLLTTFADTRTGSLASAFALCFDGRLGRALRASGAAVHDLGPVRARAPLDPRARPYPSATTPRPRLL
jgi:hypothetical protein